MARRRDGWTLSGLPGALRAHADAVAVLSQVSKQRAHTLASDPFLHRPLDPHARDRALLVAQTCDAEATVCRSVETPLYWVTKDMAQVALDASQDIPALIVSGAPSPSGVIAVEGGLPPLTPTDARGWMTMQRTYHREPIRPDAFLWRTDARGFHVVAFTHTSRMPAGVRFYDGPLHELLTLTVRRAPDGSWPVLDTPAADDKLRVERAHGMDMIEASPERLAVLAWLCAAWHLMQMPTVAERVSIDPRTGGRARSEMTSPVDPPEVTRVELRPLRHVHTADQAPPGQASTTRTYSHRWIVRGHWAQQPHGKNRALRKLIWRESYIKGPETAPLKRSRPVNVWRR